MILNMESNSTKEPAQRAARVPQVPRKKVIKAVKAVAAGDACPEAGARWVGRTGSKTSRRDAILRSVGRVLGDSRLSSLTMQDIAVELGITKGNLYYYFKDKQDILYQCHMRCMEVSLDGLRDVRSRQAEIDDPLHALLLVHITGMLTAGFGSVMLADLDNLNPSQRKRYVTRRDEFETGVREFIELGVARGIYECQDPKLAGLAILGAINWVPKWYSQQGSMTSAQIAQGLTDFLMRALWTPKPR